MRTICLLLSCTLLCSCGLYSYAYKSDERKIVSKKGNAISRISIETAYGKDVAYFEEIESNPGKEFSLVSFSPDHFKCVSGCDFKFLPDSVYEITVLPKGDRALLPIKIKAKADGSFEFVGKNMETGI